MQPEVQPTGSYRPVTIEQFSPTQQRVLRNTYLLLALSLIPTAIGALVSTQINFGFILASPAISSIGFLVIAYGLMFAIQANRNSGLGVALLLAFTLFMGVALGPLLQWIIGFRNGPILITMAAGGTATIFFVMAGIATTTKRDLSSLGKFLAVGGIVLILAVVGNIFFQNMVANLTIVSLFVLFSTLVILWQINAIVRGGENNYISATLVLYVQIYNLFTSLLQLLGIFGGQRN